MTMAEPFLSNENVMESYLPSGFSLQNFQFEKCSGSNCFQYSSEAQETVTCYEGLSVTSASGSVEYRSIQEKQCKVHNLCQTSTMQTTNAYSGEQKTFTFFGCGDPADTRFEWSNVLPVVPKSDDVKLRQRQCAQYGCYEDTLGMCVCQNDFDVSKYVTVSNHVKEQCDTAYCNSAYSKPRQTSCIEGIVSYEFETGNVLFDNTKETTCGFGQTKCYQATMTATVGNYPIKQVHGGCLMPFSEPFLKDASYFGKFLPKDGSLRSYEFDTCTGINCFEFSSDAQDTISCYDGVTVVDDSTGDVVFHQQSEVQCKLHNFCQTVSLLSSSGSNGKQNFIYTGCGDPYKGNGLWNLDAVLPVVPASTEDADTRQRQCAQWGCFEGVMGMCVCPNDFDVSTVATVSDYNADQCYNELCNEVDGENKLYPQASSTEQLTCLSGTISSNNGVVSFDDTKEVTCPFGYSKCFTQTINAAAGDWNIKAISAGCLFPRAEPFLSSEALNAKYLPGHLSMTSFSFESCSEPNCNDVSNAEPGITCNSGLSVTNARSGEVVFNHAESQQCKVSEFCQVISYTVTDTATREANNFKYSGCGDSYNTKYAWGNLLPVVPQSMDETRRQRQCNKYGCYESVLGMCVCQRDFPVSDHVTLSNYYKSRCVDDLCNTGSTDVPAVVVQPQPSEPEVVVPPVVVVEEPEVVEEEVVDETPEEETPDFLPEAPIAMAALKNLGKVSNYLKKKISGFNQYEYQTEQGYVWNGVEWVWGNNEMTNDIFEEGNKVFFTYGSDNGDDLAQAPYGSQYKFDNHEFSTETSHPFHAVMWIDNVDEEQNSPFKLKVESSLKSSNGKVSKFHGISRGKNKYAGYKFSLHYAVYQVNQGKGSDAPSTSELFYVVSSTDKWDSSFDGEMDISFADTAGETSNSVALSSDTQNVFFGYTLLAKDSNFQKKDLRRAIRAILKAYSNVDIPGHSDGSRKRTAEEEEWWNHW